MTWDKSRFEDALAEYDRSEDDPNDPKVKKRNRILEAATASFITHGYRRTSIDDVARTAGVSKGAVYLYFKSKADLLMHAAAFEKLKFKPRLMAIMDPALTPRERLRLYIVTVFTLVQDMPLGTRLTRGSDRDLHHVMQDMSASMRERMEADQQMFLGSLLKPFAAHHGWTEADVADRAAVFVSVVINAANLLDQPPVAHMPAAKYAEVIADILMEGLA